MVSPFNLLSTLSALGIAYLVGVLEGEKRLEASYKDALSDVKRFRETWLEDPDSSPAQINEKVDNYPVVITPQGFNVGLRRLLPGPTDYPHSGEWPNETILISPHWPSGLRAADRLPVRFPLKRVREAINQAQDSRMPAGTDKPSSDENDDNGMDEYSRHVVTLWFTEPAFEAIEAYYWHSLVRIAKWILITLAALFGTAAVIVGIA